LIFKYDFHKTVQDPSHGEFQHVHFRKDRPDLLPLIKRKVHVKQANGDTSLEISTTNKKSKSSGKNSSTGISDNIPNPSNILPLSSSKTVSRSAEDIDLFSSNDLSTQIFFESPRPSSTRNSSGSRVSHKNSSINNSAMDGLNVHSLSGPISSDPTHLLEEVMQQQAAQENFERRLKDLERQSVRISGENALLKRVMIELGGRQTETQQRLDLLLMLLQSAFIQTDSSLPPNLAESAVSSLCIYCIYRNLMSLLSL
jgi:hypothetical protein